MIAYYHVDVENVALCPHGYTEEHFLDKHKGYQAKCQPSRSVEHHSLEGHELEVGIEKVMQAVEGIKDGKVRFVSIQMVGYL